MRSGTRTVAAVTAGLDPGGLAAAGYCTLEVAEPVRLGRDDEFDLAFLRLLRDAMSHTLRVTWTAMGLPAVDPVLLSHLQPPRAVTPDTATATTDSAAGWRDAYGYGRCYYRVGPAFVTVRDSRVADANARYLIDDAEAVDAFPATERVTHLPSAPAAVRDLFTLLLEEGLAVQLGEHATLLPNRMRSWPVPFNAI